MNGTFYAVGVGPGDPDLLTLKAVRILDMADVIACPAKDAVPGLAYRIAEQACPQISSKEIIPVCFPMSRGDLEKAHDEAADRILSQLKSGKSVAFLTLGDPGFYSTFFYIADRIRMQGFETEIINGIPSFCAVSAKLKQPLALGEESALVTSGEFCDFDGTLIIMKAGRSLKHLKEKVLSSGKNAFLVENCGMPGEKIYRDISTMPDQTGYFSLLIVPKEKQPQLQSL